MGASDDKLSIRVLGALRAVYLDSIGPVGYPMMGVVASVVKGSPAAALLALESAGLVEWCGYTSYSCREYQLTQLGWRVYTELDAGKEVELPAGLPLGAFGLPRDDDSADGSAKGVCVPESDWQVLTMFVLGGGVGNFTDKALAAYISAHPQAEQGVADPQEVLIRLEEAGMVTKADDSHRQITPAGHVLLSCRLVPMLWYRVGRTCSVDGLVTLLCSLRASMEHAVLVGRLKEALGLVWEHAEELLVSMVKAGVIEPAGTSEKPAWLLTNGAGEHLAAVLEVYAAERQPAQESSAV